MVSHRPCSSLAWAVRAASTSRRNAVCVVAGVACPRISGHQVASGRRSPRVALGRLCARAGTGLCLGFSHRAQAAYEDGLWAHETEMVHHRDEDGVAGLNGSGEHKEALMARSQGDPIQRLMNLMFKAHPWHGVSIGEKAPEVVTAYIEIVPTDTVKYEVDKGSGFLKVDRPQRFSNYCPVYYGLVPQTYCGEKVAAMFSKRAKRKDMVGDGDPLDICVLTEK